MKHGAFFACTFVLVLFSTLLVPTVILAGQAGWRPVAPTDVPLLFASGIIAIALSDTLFHASLNMVGAGISSIVDCLYPPLTVLFAWTLLLVVLGFATDALLEAMRARAFGWREGRLWK